MNHAPEPAASKIRVLLVEDTAALRMIVRNAFNRTGRYEVVAEADDGGSGLEAARVHRPDLVMLDLNMKPVDGYTALPQLRELLPEARIVVFTGFDEVMHRPDLLAAGAADAIGKGEPLGRVIERVDRLF